MRGAYSTYRRVEKYVPALEVKPEMMITLERREEMDSLNCNLQKQGGERWTGFLF
jgi:hypothetical protein